MKVLSVLAGLCVFLTAFIVSHFALGLSSGAAGLSELFVVVFIGGPAAVIGFALAFYAKHKSAELLPESIGIGLVAGFLLACSCWFYHWQKDWPAVILHADYYNEEGFALYLREGGTFKIMESSWASGTATYGTYTIADGVILLSKEVKLSGGCLLDRQFIRKGNYLHFTCKNGVTDRQSRGPLFIRREY